MKLTNYKHDNLIQVTLIIATSVFVIYWIAKGTLWLYHGNRVFFWMALVWWIYVAVFWTVHLVRNAWDRLRTEPRPATRRNRIRKTTTPNRRCVRIGLDGSEPKFVDIDSSYNK